MSQDVSPDDLRQLARYSWVHLLVCLPFVALGGFGVIPPWVFLVVSIPLGAVVGLLTLRPPWTGALAGMTGMAVAGLLSGALSAAGVLFDPRAFRDPRWTVGLAVGAVIGCLIGWYVWDVVRGSSPPDEVAPRDDEPHSNSNPSNLHDEQGPASD